MSKAILTQVVRLDAARREDDRDAHSTNGITKIDGRLVGVELDNDGVDLFALEKRQCGSKGVEDMRCKLSFQ
jgi:hypothetical protein